MVASESPAFRLPAFVMGLANLPFGLFFSLALVTAPQLLAARGVPEPRIAAITAAALVPSFACFLLAPVLDVRFSRRAYALALGFGAALLAALTLASVDRLDRFVPLLVAGGCAAGLYNIAIGGWLGEVVRQGDEGRLAAGFQVGNAVGFGAGAVIFIAALRGLPPVWGAAADGAVVGAPLALIAFIPASHRDRLRLHESFAQLGRDLAALARRRSVRRVMCLAALPSCAFALSNTLTGLGGVYGASERFVAFAAGPAVTVVGVLGALAVPPLLRRLRPGTAFLLTGLAGAAFTVLVWSLPRAPWVLAFGISGENGLQSVAFAIVNAINFHAIGDRNPLAATQFALVNAAMAFPVTYMQWIDGQTFGAHGLDGMLLGDAALALAGVSVLLPLLRRWHRSGERSL